MGGHDGKNSGWGKRDQDFGNPHPDPALADGPDNQPDNMTNKPGQNQGTGAGVPGAHGDRPPHQDIKPGTKLDLEQNS